MTELPQNLDTILHIGAGHGDELAGYLDSDAKRILLVEPNPSLAARLRARSEHDARVTVVEAAITDDPSHNQLTEYNLPEAASLHQPSGLRHSFPGLRISAQHPVATTTLQQLLEQHPPGSGKNLLVIQAPGEELAIAKALAAIDTAEPFSHLWLTCPRETFYNSAGRAADVLAELQRLGYDVQSAGDENDDWPQWQLACNPLARKVQALEIEKQALTEALKQSKNELEYAHATLASNKRELTEARKEFDQQQSDWQAQKQALNTRLENAMQHSTEAEQTVQQLQARETELGAALSQANSMARQLREQLDAQQAEIAELKARAAQHNEAQAQSDTALKQANARITELETSLNEAKGSAANGTQEREKLAKERQAAQQKADELAASVKSEQQRNAELKQQLDNKNAKLAEADKIRQQAEESKARAAELTKQLEQAKAQQADTSKQADAAQARIQELEQENQSLQNTLQQLQSQLESDTSSQKELADLKQRMEYLFEQNSLQLEQAANALGRHVSATAQTTAKELEAGIALQQQYGGDVPALESGNTRLPSTVALALSRQLKSQPYDLIIELGSGVTTTFMAHTLRNQNGQRRAGEPSNDTQVSRYIDPSEDDLPKRIVCFEHNRSTYNQRLESLKASGLSAFIGLQFAPLVPYNHQGQEHLFYDCATRLQQIAKLFEERQARIFVLVNQPAGDSQPEPLVALPQVLQYLSAHTLDVVVNAQGREGLRDEWQKLLTHRGLESKNVEFGAKYVQRLTVNP